MKGEMLVAVVVVVVVLWEPLRRVWMVARRLAAAGTMATRMVSQAVMLKDIRTCVHRLVSLRKCAVVYVQGIYSDSCNVRVCWEGSVADEVVG